MSKYFAPNNKESAKDLYQKRLYYWAYVRDKSLKNVVDFSTGEKVLYGRVGRSMQPITLKQGTLKSLKNAARPAEPQQAINFVADIFNEMCRQFEKKATLSQIATNDPYLSKLVVHRSYVSPQKLFFDHQEKYMNRIAKLFQSQKMYFSNFEEFLTLLTPILQSSCKTSRFTYPGFVKSIQCSVMSTGLAIEIADLDYANDEKKVEQFLRSKNWDFYINTCNSYGFMVDLNIPWRIVADIESDAMKEIAERYGYYGVDSIFKKAYGNPNAIDIDRFLATLLALYNLCKVYSYDELEDCTDGTTRVKKIYPQQYTTFREIIDSIGIWRVLRFYTYLRLFEEKPELSLSQMDEMASEVISLARENSTPLALCIYLEGIINKEFDKVGSASYIMKANEVRKEMELMRKEDTTDPSNYRYADIARKQQLEWEEKPADGEPDLIPEDLWPDEEKPIWD